MRYRQTGKAKRRYDLRAMDGTWDPAEIERLWDLERTQEGPTPFHVRGYSKPLRDPTPTGFSASVKASQEQMAAAYGVPVKYLFGDASNEVEP